MAETENAESKKELFTGGRDPGQVVRSVSYLQVLAQVQGWLSDKTPPEEIWARVNSLARLYQEQGAARLRAGCKEEAQGMLRMGVGYAMAAQSIHLKFKTAALNPQEMSGKV